MLAASLNANDYIPTHTADGVVYEFGDFGKAPNQIPTEVGDLNVISSKIVTQIGTKILINDSFVSPSNESTTTAGGSSAAVRPSSEPTE